MDTIPAGTFTIEITKHNVFGMPDAYDQGGIYLEMEKMNEDYINFWIIDNDTKNIPDYLREFTKQIQKNIQILVK